MVPAPRSLTLDEQAAIAMFDGEVTVCPPGGHEPTWRQSFSQNLAASMSETGAKKQKPGS